jgi:hypothetical protein
VYLHTSFQRRLQRHALALSNHTPVRGKRPVVIGVGNMTDLEKQDTLRASQVERRRLVRKVAGLQLAALHYRSGFSERLLDRGNPEVPYIVLSLFI